MGDQVRIVNFALVEIVLIWQSAKKEGECFRRRSSKLEKELDSEVGQLVEPSPMCAKGFK